MVEHLLEDYYYVLRLFFFFLSGAFGVGVCGIATYGTLFVDMLVCVTPMPSSEVFYFASTLAFASPPRLDNSTYTGTEHTPNWVELKV